VRSIHGLTYLLTFNFLTFGHSGAECQSAQMSQIKNGGLDFEV